MKAPGLTAALLLSTDCFEGYFEEGLGLTRDAYLARYRNDWAWDYADALRDHGVDALIYVPSLRHDGIERTEDGFGVRFLRLGRPYHLWHRVPLLRRSPPGRYLGEAANGLCLLRGLRRALACDGADVLYVQEYWTGRFDTLALSGLAPLIGADQGGRPRRQLKLAKRWSFPRAEFLTTLTTAESANVARYRGIPKPLVNAVDTTLFRFAEDRSAEPRTLLTVARLHDAQKRVSDLIRALVHLPSDWRLDIVGSGPDEHALRAVCEREGVAERVTFYGFVDDKEVIAARMRGCAVFALPSAWEGMPIALLEAMSSGAAVVVSDIPAMTEVIRSGENGLVVPVGAPKLLANAVQTAERRCSDLRRQARRTVEERYSRAALGSRLAGLMREAAVAREPTWGGRDARAGRFS